MPTSENDHHEQRDGSQPSGLDELDGLYERFRSRPIPSWFPRAKLGIFVHWGAYSVPAWAEPIGALGTIDATTWFQHNPYAEWYANTIRLAGSPAAEHHARVHGGRPYEEFLDQWQAEEFDADALLRYVADLGARYFVPTTKHHDGITLWDAPGSGDLTTVARGPHRDLVGEMAAAAERHGVQFGVYYSGGLDWHFERDEPVVTDDPLGPRPVGADYAAYAHSQLLDLVERYRPAILWGDIEWPDAGKPGGPYSLAQLFDRFYEVRPDGVVNDRWGAETHRDFHTSEYEAGVEKEQGGPWENTRGIGFSFGYNQVETEQDTLSGPAAVKHFVDVVSRGGNLLLNIGLTAAGTIPPLQRATLDHLGAWNHAQGAAVFDTTPFPDGSRSDAPWARWTSTDEHAFLIVDAADHAPTTLPALPDTIDPSTATLLDGTPVTVDVNTDGHGTASLALAPHTGVIAIRFNRANRS